MKLPGSGYSEGASPASPGSRRAGERLLAFLQITRFPNLFTAMADVSAGYLIVAGTGIRGSTLAFLLLSSSALYAGGCVLNDLRDREIDARERPFRPLPSGRISDREALFLCIGLFLSGFAFALMAGRGAAITGSLLILLILSYDFGTKHRVFLGPLNMGACRSANLLLGMSPSLANAGPFLIFPAITLAHVFFLTRLSRFEAGEYAGDGPRGVFMPWILLVGALAVFLFGRELFGGLFFLVLLVVLVFPPLFDAFRKPGANRSGAAVKMMILVLPLLDAVYATAAQGWAFGIPVALLILPSYFLSRILYMT